jgi:hypothetical protein
MVDKETARFAYLDLLVKTLSEHEKQLETLIEKIEQLSRNNYNDLNRKGEKETLRINNENENIDSQNIIFMKLKLNRTTEELKEILKILKK